MTMRLEMRMRRRRLRRRGIPRSCALTLLAPDRFSLQSTSCSGLCWDQDVLFRILCMFLSKGAVEWGALRQLLCSQFPCLWTMLGILACSVWASQGGSALLPGGWFTWPWWPLTICISGSLWSACQTCRGGRVPCIFWSMQGSLCYPEQAVPSMKFPSWVVVAKAINWVQGLRSCWVLCKVWDLTAIPLISLVRKAQRSRWRTIVRSWFHIDRYVLRGWSWRDRQTGILHLSCRTSFTCPLWNLVWMSLTSWLPPIWGLTCLVLIRRKLKPSVEFGIPVDFWRFSLKNLAVRIAGGWQRFSTTINLCLLIGR